MNIHLIRTGGSEERIDAPFGDIRHLIGADCLDGFKLRDGRYVMLDDAGHEKGLPDNAKATALYRSICKPGTTHRILGDVAIVVDAEVT